MYKLRSALTEFLPGGQPLLASVRLQQRKYNIFSSAALPPLITLTVGSVLAISLYNTFLAPAFDTEGLYEIDSGTLAGTDLEESILTKEPKNGIEIHLAGKRNGSSASHKVSLPLNAETRGVALSSLPVAPRTTILDGPAKHSPEKSPIMKFTADRGGCSFEIQLDSSRWIPAHSPLRFKQPLPDGHHVFRARAVDANRVRDPSPAELQWWVDTERPRVEMQRKPPRITRDGSARFEAVASEERCKFPFRLQYRRGPDEEWEGAESHAKGGGGAGHTDAVTALLVDKRRIRITVKGLLEGYHKLTIGVTDEAGNEGESVEHEWSVDLTPPKTAIKQGPRKFTKSRVAVFAISAKGVEPGWSYQYNLNDGGWIRGPTATVLPQLGDAYQLSLAGLMEGPQSLSVRAIDLAGNVDKAGDTYRWTIHVKPAETILLSTPPHNSNGHLAAFTISSTETQFSFAYKLDGGPVQRPLGLRLVKPPTTFNITNLKEGNHSIMIRATDVTGGEDPTPALFRWHVDLTPPEVRILRQPPAVTLDTSAVITVEADEPYALHFKLDNGVWKDSDGTILRPIEQGGAKYRPKILSGETRLKLTDLSEGKHLMLINLTDAVGNTRDVPPIVWAVDFGPPSTKLEAMPAQQTKIKKATFVVSASEPDCVIQYRLDRKAWLAPGADPGTVKARSIPGREDRSAVSFQVWPGSGFHFIEFRAKDSAGNVDKAGASHEWVTY